MMQQLFIKKLKIRYWFYNITIFLFKDFYINKLSFCKLYFYKFFIEIKEKEQT